MTIYNQNTHLQYMKILSIVDLALPDVKVIRFARFSDHRGYFAELYKESDFFGPSSMAFMKGYSFKQMNESYSQKETMRGLHFQWKPLLGKLIRTESGHMVDLILDIRKNSPTLGKIIAYDMPSKREDSFQEWIWIPPGFAHGNFFLEDTTIQYLCTAEWGGVENEAGISPFAQDIDWSLCDSSLKALFDQLRNTQRITDKDKNGFTVQSWMQSENSHYFTYTK